MSWIQAAVIFGPVIALVIFSWDDIK